MQPVPSRPRIPEGLFFALADLQAAMAWAESLPGLRLFVATDHYQAPEAIEIYPSGSAKPRWIIWRDHRGDLRVDDWQKFAFDLPYSTVTTALRFIGAILANTPSQGSTS
jgi:hypothetical protein